MEEIIRNIKEIHKNTVLLLKVGSFYHAYGKDAYIISYLFRYQMKRTGKGYNTCGMPTTGLNKVLKGLEDKKINYLVLIKSQSYAEETRMDFDVNNRYLEIYEKAYRNVNLKKRIDEIYDYLNEHLDDKSIKTMIQEVEELLDKERQ